MKALWTKFINAIRRLFHGRQLFALVWPSMSNDANRKINNGELQALALEAVKAAAEAGLKGGEARTAAVAKCKALLTEIGVELADRMIDTLVQVVYMQFRDVEG